MSIYHYRYLFGPVLSRRLGFSLGLDVTPMKTCTFNCVYCQLGRTTHQTIARREYVPPAEVMAELADYLAKEDRADYVTFSGSGEPTLHSKLGEMIVRAKQMSEIPVAVLTCSALINDAQVRRELACADVILPSLDAASPGTFDAINRPHGRLVFADMIEGLKRLRREYSGRIWLEIMMVKGVNDGAEEVAMLRQAVSEIKPDKVHLNTVVRPPAESDALALSETELQALQREFGPPAEIIAPWPSPSTLTFENRLMPEALNLIARHPSSLDEISSYLNCSAEIVAIVLNSLLETGEVERHLYQGKTFYAAAASRDLKNRKKVQNMPFASQA